MVNKVALIRFDSQAGAWTDETNWVKGSIIRRFAKERMGKKQLRAVYLRLKSLHTGLINMG